MSTLVSVRNTDSTNPIKVMSARYYDTDGKMLREHAESSRLVPVMGTIEYFVEHKDLSGGSGANFLIRWESEIPVNPQIVESVHAYFQGTQAMAFISPGRVIRTSEGE